MKIPAGIHLLREDRAGNSGLSRFADCRTPCCFSIWNPKEASHESLADRAHLKALWTRDERQRGMMRCLVLLTLPALTLAGLLDYTTLIAALMCSCYALCHIST